MTLKGSSAVFREHYIIIIFISTHWNFNHLSCNQVIGVQRIACAQIFFIYIVISSNNTNTVTIFYKVFTFIYC